MTHSFPTRRSSDLGDNIFHGEGLSRLLQQSADLSPAGGGVVFAYPVSDPERYGVVEFDSDHRRSEEHTSELQSLMRISYAVFCLKKKNTANEQKHIKISPVLHQTPKAHRTA